MTSVSDTNFKLKLNTAQKSILFIGSSADFKNNWRNCHLLTDEYCSLSKKLLPQMDQNFFLSLSTIINELVENAVKFSVITHPEISLDLSFNANLAVIETSNYCTKKNYESLLEAKQKVSFYNPDDLFFTHMQSIESETNISKLGIITLFQFPETKLTLHKTSYTDYINLKIKLSFKLT